MLEVFRKKAKIIIYITAFVFIVGMAIMGISGLFDQRRATHVGEIAGEKITYQQYSQWFRNQLQSFTQENPDQELDDATVQRINDQTWQQLVQMVLFDQDREPLEIASDAHQVFDVSGAGDTVIAIIGLGIASGASFTESALIANAAAGIVVAKVGTATPSVEELKNAL